MGMTGADDQKRSSRPSRPKLIRRRIAVFSAVIVVLAGGIYLPATLLAPLAPTDARLVPYSAPAHTAASLAFPAYGASAVGAIGYPEALTTAGSSDPLPIASISKIVTSLVVLQKRPLTVGEPGPTITFTTADAALTAKYVALNGETKPLRAGATITQLDLMRVTLVASANNYADALAEWAYGSQSGFTSAVAAWLADHGLSHTTIVEPTGINPGNVSTATDLVKIGTLALENPVIASIVSTESMSLSGVGTFDNTNTLLGHHGVQGIKTGTLNGSSNLLFAARYTIGGRTITVVGAVIGATDHRSVDASVSALLAGVKAGFHQVTLTPKGRAFADFRTRWASTARAVTTKAATALVWSNTPVTAVVATDSTGLAPRRTAVGRVTFTVGSQTVQVPLVLDHALADPGPWWRLTNPSRLLG